ncbi:hypothetical protein GR138_26815 [Shinella kummerowiae]|uniref:Uncharacterized protein n=1 Tax=Shinella kummerowiae TaxID=417745 RepID=A0A6N8SNI7_9HYPH|nr:hypothetical protein [Shinella kummerowiae]MXN48816.1 hypothetical protein [Shinella kummerowiae]
MSFYLNVAGLIANIMGVGIVFFFALPQPSFDAGGGLGVDDSFRFPDGKTLGEMKRDAARDRKVFGFRARVGLFLMFVGFVFQLLAAFAS